MPRKRKHGLSDEEIRKVIDEPASDDEEYADSDSECEESALCPNLDVDESILEANDKNEKCLSFKQIDWCTESSSMEAPKVLKFTGPPAGVKHELKNQIRSEIDCFSLFFDEKIIQILIEETNRYANQQLNKAQQAVNNNENHMVKWKNITKNDLFKFLGLVLLMGQIEKEKIREYWSTDKLIETPIFSSIMSRDRFLLILKYLHFANNEEKKDSDDPSYDRLWKIRDIFDEVNNLYKQSYNPSESLSIDEVIVKFKGRVIFKQYIPKKHKRWGIKIYKICDEYGYTYNMTVYLGRDKLNPTLNASHQVVMNMSECIAGKGHKMYMDNYFSSPNLFLDLFYNQKINSCGTAQSKRKNFPSDVITRKMKKGDMNVRYGEGMIAVCWKDKREVLALSNIHDGRNQTTGENKDVKPQIIEDYNKHMGYVDLSDRMANSYTFGRKSVKWTKKLFFHLVDLSVVNAFVIWKNAFNPKMSHLDFRKQLIRSLLSVSDESNANSATSMIPNVLNSNATSPHLKRPKLHHWPLETRKRRRCAYCSSQGIQRRSTVICQPCNTALCIEKSCFKDYHELKVLV